MGAFYQSFHVRAATEQVRSVLEPLCVSNGPQAWVGPTLDGWTTVFPDVENGAVLAQRLSAQLETAVLLTLVHDSDVFYYLLFAPGCPVEQFVSPADAMGEAGQSKPNDSRQIFELLTDDASRGKLRLLLQSEMPDFAEERMGDMLRLMGIKNGLSSYDYLEAGEHDTVTGWSQFVHLPDRTAEKARRLAEKRARNEKKKRLRKQGILLFDSELMRKPKLPSKFMLRLYGSAARRDDFLVGGFDGNKGLMRWNPPEAPIGLEGDFAPTHGFHLVATPDNTAFVSGEERCALVDLSNGKKIKTISAARGIPLAYDNRTGHLYLHSGTTLSAVDVAADEVIFSSTVEQHINRAVLHPTQSHLLWHSNYLVGITNVATGEQIVKLRAYNSGLREKRQALWAKHGHVPTDAATLEREDVFSLNFDATGERLFGATTEGLREYRYGDVLHSCGQMPRPIAGVETSFELQDYRYVYSMIVDEARGCVVFAGGSDDAVCWYDWRKQASGVLKSAETDRKIWALYRTGGGSKLLCQLGPGNADILKRQDDHWLQVWSYEKLWSM